MRERGVTGGWWVRPATAVFGGAVVACLTSCGGQSVSHDAGEPGAGGTRANSNGEIGAGSPNIGGTSGVTGNATGPVLDWATVDCGAVDPTTALTNGCAKLGCHVGSLPSDALNLAPDSGLAARLKDRPAQFGELSCPTAEDPFATCTTPPSACPHGELLVDSQDLAASWMLKKLQPTRGCGDVMPPQGYRIESEDRACVENIIRAIAELP